MRRTSSSISCAVFSRVVLHLGEVAAEEDLVFLLAERHRPELLAHAVLADHASWRCSVACLMSSCAPVRDVAEDDLLGGAAAEAHLDAAEAPVLGDVVALVGRQRAW